ncbi:MAG: flavin reductase [Candidatus Faecousia sp.]|nr:flavin reductase [Candidatus Faecousia sp.]
MTITKDIRYVGVNDHQVDLFEGQYDVPNGMAYNSYVIMDDKIAVMDTVDRNFTHEWLDNIQNVLKDRKPDYLVVQHMEPDHSANIANFLKVYPQATVVSSVKAFQMMKQFFGDDYADRRIVVGEGSTLELGKHTLTFVTAPMVHWPEVIVTYDSYDKVLFSADGFGKFGALDVDEDWACEARRYYIGIVGKYGPQVQALLKKASGLDISIICPLHGPVLTENLGYYINLYDIWSSYRVESEGIVVAYTSVYGHTKAAVELLVQQLKAKGCPKVEVHDLARCDMAEAVEDAFRYGKLVLATTTYNADIFPFMKEFIHHLTERNFQNRTIALMENGTWAPLAAKVMRGMFESSKNLTFTDTTVRILSALNDESKAQIEALADELCKDYLARQDATANKNDLTALFNIGYGLYVVTSNDGQKDNGLIVNTVSQVTNTPNRVAVTINKANYSYHVIKQTGIMNVNCLDVSAPFSVFQNFGFQSGRTADKFAGIDELRADNGLRFLPRYINSFMSLKVESFVDLDTHGMFICSVTEARVISDKETMTYTYYQNNVKPKPQTEGKKGYVCKVCGWVYEGDTLPDDIVCPLCKHGAADFEPIG